MIAGLGRITITVVVLVLNTFNELFMTFLEAIVRIILAGIILVLNTMNGFARGCVQAWDVLLNGIRR